MPKWDIVFVPESEDDLERLSPTIRKRIIKKLDWFQNNFDTITPLALGGKWQDFFKFRVGNWRVIYQIDWSTYEIIIIAIDHRSKIYKRKRTY